MFKYIFLSTLYSLSLYIAQAQCTDCLKPTANLVLNGDFSQGKKGFNSDYGSQKNLIPEALYYITNDAHLTHPGFHGNDHTTGSGNFMVVNGSYISNSSVWCQTIKIKPNTQYAFSTWLCSVGAGNPASLQFGINGVNLGSPFVAPTITNSWIQFSQCWNSGKDTVAKICIINQNTIRSGNDFGLDDISFSACPQNPLLKLPVETSNILKVHAQKLSIQVWDDGIVDDDIVSLNLNGEWILENYTIKAQKHIIEVVLNPGENNLVLYAISEGRKKPCTVAVSFDDGHKVEKLLIESHLKKASSVQINYILQNK